LKYYDTFRHANSIIKVTFAQFGLHPDSREWMYFSDNLERLFLVLLAAFITMKLKLSKVYFGFLSSNFFLGLYLAEAVVD
jgi:hypothetical protein